MTRFTPKATRGVPCALYRHYDEQDVLLYIGISDVVTARGRSHAHSSDWTRYAVRFTGQWFPDRKSAEVAERAAIEREAPVFNRQHATGDPWGRIEHYLAGRQHKSAVGREHLVTLREAAREGWVVNTGLRGLRRYRRSRVGGFPQHAGRLWRLWKLYSEEELLDWTTANAIGVFDLTWRDRWDLYCERHRYGRRRTRGAPVRAVDQGGAVS